LVNDGLFNTIHALPKIELHRHLEGAVRLETLVELAHEFDIMMPEDDIETLRPFVQMMPNETRNSQHFLGKFQTIRQFFRSPQVIQRVTREAIEDAAADNVKYMELRFTPRALSNILNCSYYEVIEWVCASAADISSALDIQVKLIVSMNRHESVDIGEHVLAAAVEYRNQGVVALDLAGNEGSFPSKPFWRLFRRAKELGLGVTIHAGEWGGASNVREAVERLHADRVGHGVRSVEEPELVDWLAERRTVLEVCPTSNIQSGVVVEWSQHPLRELVRRQVLTTINTDDPLVSNITLTNEFMRVVEDIALELEDVKLQILNAARSAFLPDSERAALVAKFENLLEINQ
jgi:adenosine deaminase